MKTIILFSILLSCFLYTPKVFSSYTPVPRDYELLSQEIQLECEGIRVVEWRPMKILPTLTAPSKEGIQAMNAICRRALEEYPAFFKMRFGVEIQPQAFNLKISMIPSNIYLDGKDSRNLNDLKDRFASIGLNCCFWGLYVDNLNFLFMRNDPLRKKSGHVESNPYFARTFAHELAHVMNHQWHLRGKYFPNNDVDDELLAEEFVTYLGFKFKTETSSADYNMKTGQ